MATELFGCVNWVTGKIQFYTLDTCNYCYQDFFDSCLVNDGGAHDGSIAITIDNGGCSDTYYACFDGVDDKFKVSVPDACVGSIVSVTFTGLSDTNICYSCGVGLSYQELGVAATINGVEFTLERDAPPYGCIYDTDPHPVVGNWGTRRLYDSEKCEGTYWDETIVSLWVGIVIDAGGVDVTATTTTPSCGENSVFEGTGTHDDCYNQVIDNADTGWRPVCSGGIATLVQTN